MFKLIFDKVMSKQILSSDKVIKKRLSTLFDKLELQGPRAGKLLDPKLGLYELKCINHSIRVYFCYKKDLEEIHVFFFEMKKSKKRQQATIDFVRKKFFIFLNLFSYTSFL